VRAPKRRYVVPQMAIFLVIDFHFEIDLMSDSLVRSSVEIVVLAASVALVLWPMELGVEGYFVFVLQRGCIDLDRAAV
jgi:hypothetical protein